MRKIIYAICLVLVSQFVQAQTCTTPGQTPSTAFPVCGTTTFQQTTVPICNNQSLVVPGCSGVPYSDKNPYWYRFTCYQSGTLGFLIAPANSGDDYDWQLYDITGRNPNDVYTDPGLIVTGNWAGTFGNTGASASGVNFIQCASDPADNANSFSSMPNLIVGHTYLLMVSHFTNTQSGYNLSFGGGTAVITDPKQPAVFSAEANCGGNQVRVKLNKKIRCNSLALDGSDFSISPGVNSILSATGINCSNGFDTDSVIITLGSFLAPGNYTLNIKFGADGNTLLDNCGNAIPVNNNVGFTVLPALPTPMDSLVPVKCKPQSLTLVFGKPILCSSIAANGSDFIINGSYPVSITSATATCTGSVTREITIHLSNALYTGGNFNLVLQTGTDGNTLLDECGKETPAGSSLPFFIKDTVNASFTFEKKYGCVNDTVNYFHPGGNGINSWQWDLDDGITSTIQNPQVLYQVFDEKNIMLVVSNGFCSDSSSQKVILDNFIKADFIAFEDNCPNEKVQFTGTAIGKIDQHQWSFGDGGTANIPSPDHIFSQPLSTISYPVTYTVTDSLGCSSSVVKNIKIYSSCFIAVPNAFTPNNDGRNDFLKVLNAIKAEQLKFRVFNRWGQLVFETTDWKRGWDGMINNIPQGNGVYIWYLYYTDRDTNEKRTLKGTATLIR